MEIINKAMDEQQTKKRGRLLGVRDKSVRKSRPITLEQIKFSDNVLEGMNPTQAAVQAYGYDNRRLASLTAHNNLKSTAVLNYLHNQGYGAARRVVKLSKKAKNETVKLNANKDILDRAQIGVRPAGQVAAVQINFGELREKYSE